MKKIALIAFIALWGVSAVGQDYDWHHVEMDGTRTGTSSPSKDNVAEAVGTFKGSKYIAPNGKEYKKKSVVGKTARIVLDAQPAMSRVKDVIGYSTEAMVVDYPESALSNWFIDILMRKTEQLSGKKVRFMTGLNHHEGQKVLVAKKHVATWGPHPVEGKAFPVGAAVIFSDNAFPTVEKTDRVVRVISEPAAEVKTKILASSTKEAELNSAKRFEEYVVD